MGFDKEKNAENERDNNLIIGRNAVSEALRSGRNIDTLLVVRGERNGSVGRIIAECKEKGVVIKEVDKKKLDFMCGQGNHQGVAAYAAVHEYSSVEDIFALAEERGEAPFIILCDELEDPHNLGAIIRTAETAGAHGVIIPKRRNASLTWAVGKASAGAVEYVPVARVGNLASTIDDLKKRGLWVYTADMDGQNWCETDFSGPVALVVGSEGNGVSRLIREKSDFVVSLPMKGKITSLNASVAAGILMYEVSRQRSGIKAK
jgi:23S rRNA (guanosine2251-2'-O)-methyltransferase